MSPSFILSFYSTQCDSFCKVCHVILAYSVDSMLYANTKGRNYMITLQTVLEQLTDMRIVASLKEVLTDEFEDFADVRKGYDDAICQLRNELGENTSPSVNDAVDAIERQTASNLFFSGVLGLKANLDYYINPISRNFLDAGFDVFLRENTAHRLPEYEKSQEVLDRFYALLSPAQRVAYDDILEYIAYLETIGPKLAHYHGYLLGNDILYRIIPGYHPNDLLTAKYKIMLEDYLGKIHEF